ncbi:MAG: hypothetical protein GY909_09895 [Oligoflexia bacterium]|nr:hypothetical protein [Oligoflexia bacterium]
MKKISLLILLFLLILIPVGKIGYGKYKEYTSRIYLLEKGLNSLNKDLIRQELKTAGFQVVDKNFNTPVARVLSHTYAFNKIRNKKAPLNTIYQQSDLPDLSKVEMPHIVVGDFVWSDTKEDINYHQQISKNKNVYLIKGNHETMSSFDKKIKDFYDFEISNFHFIALTLKQNKEGELTFSEDLIKFLQSFEESAQESEEHSKLKKVILVHHNIFSPNLKSNLSFKDLKMLRQEIFDLSPFAIIVGDGGVHKHSYFEEVNDINVYLTGFPYVNGNSAPKWIDLYDNYLSIFVKVDNEVYEKKFIY